MVTGSGRGYKSLRSLTEPPPPLPVSYICPRCTYMCVHTCKLYDHVSCHSLLIAGFCNRESPCNKGICYYNSTGCPVVGYFPVHGRTSSNNTDTADVEDTAPGYLSYNCHFLIVLLSILLVAMVTVWLYTCKRGQTQQ